MRPFCARYTFHGLNDVGEMNTRKRLVVEAFVVPIRSVNHDRERAELF